MSQEIINNGETGLAVRNKLNNNFTETYNKPDIQIYVHADGTGVVMSKIGPTSYQTGDAYSGNFERKIQQIAGQKWLYTITTCGQEDCSVIYSWESQNGGSNPWDVVWNGVTVKRMNTTGDNTNTENIIEPAPINHQHNFFNYTDGNINSNGLAIDVGPAAANNRRFMTFFRSGTVGSITLASTTSVAYNTTSDYRLKTNITPLTGAVLRISQIPVYTFNWIAEPDSPKVDGFLAHEVQDLVPEAITGTKDGVTTERKIVGKNPNGTLIEELTEVPVYQGIDQSKLVPLLTAAVKELSQKLDVALARIETLENK